MNLTNDFENEEVESSDPEQSEGSEVQSSEILENEEVESSDPEQSEGSEVQSSECVDYTTLLESIDSRLETLESIDYSNDIKACSDNLFRLYYFIGGLYVVFFIIIAIKFFKQFF